MYTVGHLARSFGLSRSTLLYYDSIGLCKPSGRSAANYRTYTEKDRERLGRRATGSLEAYGGPLRFFYFVRVASEERDRRDDSDDPERAREKEKVWTIRVVIPNALQRTEPLEGLFELAFEEPMPPILPN